MTPQDRPVSSEQDAGSQKQRGPAFLAIGKLRRPHGVRGEMVMSVWTDFPERLLPGVTVYVGETYTLLTIRSVRWHRDDILIAFEEYTDRDQVGVLRNQIAYVRADDRPPLPEGEFYLHQLLGLNVFRDEDDLYLGEVEEIIETGSNDVLIVRMPDGKELLLPDIPSVVLDINLERNEMRVHLLPGLLPDDR